MTYTLIPLMDFLAVLLEGGVSLIADAGIRLIRGDRR